MNVTRGIDIDVRVGDSRSLRIRDEIEIEIDGEEAARAIFEVGDEATKYALTLLLNRAAAFIRKVPESEIQKLTPAVRKIIADFLHEQAKRFEA